MYVYIVRIDMISCYTFGHVFSSCSQTDLFRATPILVYYVFDHIIIIPRPAWRGGYVVNHHVHVIGSVQGTAQIRVVVRGHRSPPTLSSDCVGCGFQLKEPAWCSV